ncbi:MAG TPA: NAD(P)(+) transhydrogenase (Re/Si-specific) subunit beta [Candidatus Limnocylindrales bacterium]|jgi:NAD(P) transhydrogenase subunit beta|nr:NAD(P)(+) transhydrogenase (Re/Si-specific) subunit beta [Candidatus Limnocylindrales bacterium]
MDFETVSVLVRLAWLVGASAFVIGLMRMNSPATARNGNLVSAGGMAIAIVATAVYLLARPAGLEGAPAGFNGLGWLIIVIGIVVGGGAGLYSARTVKMTAMPQLVSLFNAVGGGAAALIAIKDYLGLTAAPTPQVNVATVLDIVIGSVTFTGSLIASGKLQGLIPGKPIVIPAGRIVTAALAAVVVLGAVYLWAGNLSVPVMVLILAAALIFGVTMVLPIGGADMPVVISLLNSFTGTAVAMAGFVLNNDVLIIAGALVGASGAILTKLMADAMNRSVMNIMIGGFGGGEGVAGEAGAGGTVRSIGPDDAAIQLAYAQNVIVVPGYGLAVAQAQHAVRELAELLEERGVNVKYAIHPVAGRMPGHMNVLLAEANVPYPQLKEMEEINPEFERADVALVVGANDVTNPAARRPGSPVSGMPILDVDKAKSIVVIKRSMGRGYAGIDNELYTNEKTGMLFADAKEGLASLVAAVKAV